MNSKHKAQNMEKSFLHIVWSSMGMKEQSSNHASTISPESCSQGSAQARLLLSPHPTLSPSCSRRRKQKSNWPSWSKTEVLVLLPILLLPPWSSTSIPALFCQPLFKGHPANFKPSPLSFFLFRSEALTVFPVLPHGFIGNGREKQ